MPIVLVMITSLPALLAVLLPQAPEVSSTVAVSDVANPVDGIEIYDPSPAHPFGRPHPNAPPELQQFAFMLGEFDCVDSLRRPDGSWHQTAAIWNAHYFLNGHGIQDVYWNDTFATSNIRLFDVSRGKWFVNFFKMPANSVGTGVWVGAQEEGQGGRSMVMWSGSEDRANGSRLTFFNIGNEGFEWVSESVRNGVATASWRSKCTRRKLGVIPKVPRFLGKEPNLVHPFGRLDRLAPAPLTQLAFQIGGFTEEQAGKVIGRRTGRWMLNGWGLQTSSYRGDQAEVLIQLFDRKANGLRITRYVMPNYEWSVWDGKQENGSAVLRETMRNGKRIAPARQMRLTRAQAGGYSVAISAAGKDVAGEDVADAVVLKPAH